jgi:hypothetical protein
MINMIIAYVLIGVVLIGYGASLYRRTRSVERSLRAFDDIGK